MAIQAQFEKDTLPDSKKKTMTIRIVPMTHYGFCLCNFKNIGNHFRKRLILGKDGQRAIDVKCSHMIAIT